MKKMTILYTIVFCLSLSLAYAEDVEVKADTKLYRDERVVLTLKAGEVFDYERIRGDWAYGTYENHEEGIIVAGWVSKHDLALFPWDEQKELAPEKVELLKMLLERDIGAKRKIQIAREFIALGPEGIDLIRKMVRVCDTSTIKILLVELLNEKDPYAAAYLSRIIRGAVSLNSIWAAYQLGKYGEKAGIQFLFKAARIENTRLSLQAAYHLGLLGDERAYYFFPQFGTVKTTEVPEKFRKMFPTPTEDDVRNFFKPITLCVAVRISDFFNLNFLPTIKEMEIDLRLFSPDLTEHKIDIVRLFAAILKNRKNSEWTRAGTAVAIGLAGDIRGLPILLLCVADRSDIVRKAAFDALTEFQKQWFINLIKLRPYLLKHQ